MRSRFSLAFQLFLAGCAASAALFSTPAAACGGLFCSAANPVNQVAERIIFAQEGDRTSAVIEIQYQGPSDSFAWVLPVPGVPEIGVSSKQALDRLQQATNPLYTLNTTFEQCGGDNLNGGGPVSAPGNNTGGSSGLDGDGNGPVTVVASGTVGPYDFNVISVSQDASNPAQLALEWLSDNAYDVSQLGEDILGSYLEEGLNLAAFRLNKNSDTGSIRPVLISYQSDQPVIPIRPTAVAADPDMGIMVWVLGSGRAVPTNYLSLTLNDTLIDWFNPNNTYNQVVIEAANEAGGHGFVTEYATGETQDGPPIQADFSDILFQQFEQQQRQNLETLDLENLLLQAGYSFGTWDGFREAFEQAVALRPAVTFDDFLNCMECYFQAAGEPPPRSPMDAGAMTPLDGGADAGSDAGSPPAINPTPNADPIWATDPAEFLELLDTLVIEPMLSTAALFPGHSVTRLYTTLSADEMTVDPAFDFNMSLGGESNIHQADRFIHCDGTWVVELPSGFVIAGENSGVWPVSLDDDVPLNLQVVQDDTEGAGEVITNNRSRIASRLDALGVVGEAPGDQNITYVNDSSGCGCRLPGSRVPVHAPWLLLAGLGVAIGLRRRAQSPLTPSTRSSTDGSSRRATIAHPD